MSAVPIPTVAEALRLLRIAIYQEYQRRAVWVEITTDGPRPIGLPLPDVPGGAVLAVPPPSNGEPVPSATAASLPSVATDGWQPDEFQMAILDALEFRALRTDDLVRESGVSRGRLYQKPHGGMDELRVRGLVRLSARYGYYRPDAPPEELVEEVEERRTEKRTRSTPDK